MPREVEGGVEKVNDLLIRFSSSLDALRNFTSNASHQFRTPLALIRTHLELAQRAETPDEKSEAIDNANKAVGEAERLMAQMLLLARIDTLSRDELSKETCDLNAVARDVCEEFVLRLSATKRSDVQLGFEGEEPVIVQARDTLLKEVVRNLIDNAIVHGGENLTIDVSVREEGLLEVKDDGVFFDGRSLSDKNHRQSGNGLGLRIVRDILNLFDGNLRFESSVRSGTLARVLFKRARV